MLILLRVLLIVTLTVVMGSTGQNAHARMQSPTQTAQHVIAHESMVDGTEHGDGHEAATGCLPMFSDCGATGVLQAMFSSSAGHFPVVVSLQIGDRVERVGAPPEFEPPPPRS